MPRPRPLPPALQAQPFTIRQATAAGLTRRRTRALDLASPCHGVRAPAAVEITLLIRARGLALATGAVVSHLSAAALWGFPLPLHFEDHKTIHLTSRGGARAVRRKSVWRPPASAPGSRNFRRPLRCVHVAASDLVRSGRHPIPAGSCHCRRLPPAPQGSHFHARRIGLLPRKEEGPGWLPKAMKARALIRANTDSPKETELRLLLTAAGLPEPGINVPMFDETAAGSRTPTCHMKISRLPSSTTAATTPLRPSGEVTYTADENARSLGWLVVVLTQLDLDPLVPGMEPSAITKVRRALTSRGWKRVR
jgi:hypothetical protein